ncbi:hypothetical protein LJC05_03925 [Bacteroides sp. OttesenSCG-928-J23]|nr:hypothetical protein [Bacteroides sp. OttesenSCG-928-J23]
MVRTNSKSTRGRGYYRRYLAHCAKQSGALLALGGLFLLGALLGTLLVRTAGGDTLTLLFKLVSGFVEKRRGQDFAANFMAAAGSSLALVAALMIGGFCAVAQPAVAAVPLLRGMGFGFSAASLYLRYGRAAMGFVGVLILPGMILSTVGVLLCCRESLRLSAALFRLLVRPPQSGRDQYLLRGYLAKYLLAAMLCVAAAGLEAALYTAFAHRFLLG